MVLAHQQPPRSSPLSRVVVPSFRFRADPRDLHAGQDSFVHGLVRALVANGAQVEVLTMAGKGDPSTALCEGATVHYLRTELSDQVSAHQLHQLSRWQLLGAMQLYGRRISTALSGLRTAHRGPLTILSQDVAEAGWLEEAKKQGDHVITFAHVLFSEFALADLNLEEFERAHAEAKFPAPLAYAARKVLKLRPSPEKMFELGRAAGNVGLTKLVPSRVMCAFEAEEAAFSRSDRVLIPSRAMRRKIARRYPRPDQNLAYNVIPWGVDVPPARDERIAELRRELGIAHGDRVLLTLSRISPDKQIDRAIAAVLEIERRNPELAKKIHLVICGRPTFADDQQYLKKLENAASAARLVRIHFRGYVSGEDRSAHLGLVAGDPPGLLLQVGRYEAFGLSIAEALSLGAPVIAGDSDGPREIFDPSACKEVARAGAMVDTSVPSIVSAIERAFTGGEFSTEAARRVGGRFTWAATLAGLEASFPASAAS